MPNFAYNGNWSRDKSASWKLYHEVRINNPIEKNNGGSIVKSIVWTGESRGDVSESRLSYMYLRWLKESLGKQTNTSWSVRSVGQCRIPFSLTREHSRRDGYYIVERVKKQADSNQNVMKLEKHETNALNRVKGLKERGVYTQDIFRPVRLPL